MAKLFISLIYRFKWIRQKYYELFVMVKYSRENIVIGRNNFFWGNVKINNQNGKIIIGTKNKFLSKETSNNIGLNHRCILSSTPVFGREGLLKIGDFCGFSGVSIWCFDKIIIGNNVRVGANVLIMDGDAHFEDKRTSPPAPIYIELKFRK